MTSSILLPQHEAAGARLSAGDARELLTYGDVPAEYREAQTEAALFDETTRGRIAVRGADAAVFLHRLLANDVRGLADGGVQRGLLLSSKGKVLFDFELLRDADTFHLSLPAERAPALLKALDTYLFAEKVVLTDESALTAPLAVCGPRTDEIVRVATGLAAAPAEHTCVRGAFAGGEVRAWSSVVAGSRGCVLDAGPERAAALWSALARAGARPAGVVVRDVLRVEAGMALSGADIDENVYPQEARLERAYSLTKGCYVGQEVVAKIDTYGGLNKRLVALKLPHDDPVPHGTRLYRLDEGEWRDLGVITSWAYSFVLDTGLALAYVKRRHQKAGTEFRVGESDARAVIVPLPVRANAVPVTGDFES
jgi:aminomethyltransferase